MLREEPKFTFLEACNGINEEYNDCSFDCLPQTCEYLDRVKVCPIEEGENCKPMCRCKPGYFRNKIGQCITEEQCSKLSCLVIQIMFKLKNVLVTVTIS